MTQTETKFYVIQQFSEVYCGYPGYVRNSLPIGRNYYFKDTITYRCYSGFTLIGNSSITCQADGTWYPNKPKCIGKIYFQFI